MIKLENLIFNKQKKLIILLLKKFKLNDYNLFLSISDEKNYSIAFTILQKNEMLIKIFY